MKMLEYICKNNPEVVEGIIKNLVSQIQNLVEASDEVLENCNNDTAVNKYIGIISDNHIKLLSIMELLGVN